MRNIFGMFDDISFKICHILQKSQTCLLPFFISCMYHNEWQLISSHILKFWRVNAQWDNTYYSEKIDNLGKPSSIGSVLRWQNPQGEGRSKEIFSTITKYREEKTASFTLKFQVFEDSKFSTKIDKTILEFLLINYFPS